ncbi:hypothetical protein LX32DRAFT_115080 [Colletotrichum zoysiae]|uniref:Uncharacterized protein n=1 Tax=Colletotrichum zoysiae TaxID=1216348 RepID=A0AAD9H924_9PEZI|nr:hypothetical protein LX32DRAFT_115080 [Colletotrichum zoysiae]
MFRPVLPPLPKHTPRPAPRPQNPSIGAYPTSNQGSHMRSMPSRCRPTVVSLDLDDVGHGHYILRRPQHHPPWSRAIAGHRAAYLRDKCTPGNRQDEQRAPASEPLLVEGRKKIVGMDSIASSYPDVRYLRSFETLQRKLHRDCFYGRQELRRSTHNQAPAHCDDLMIA